MQSVEGIGVERKSITFSKRVGCGSIYIVFIYHNNGKFFRMLIRGSMAKEAPCGSTFLDSLARLLTYSIRRSTEEDEKNGKKDFKHTSLWHGVVKQLTGNNCNNRSVATHTSCVTAIADAVKDYIKIQEEL